MSNSLAWLVSNYVRFLFKCQTRLLPITYVFLLNVKFLAWLASNYVCFLFTSLILEIVIWNLGVSYPGFSRKLCERVVVRMCSP